MAAYADLNPADKAIVDNTINLIRSSTGQMAGIWNLIKAIADDTNAVNLVASLDAAVPIPNTSALAGSDDLTRAELISIWTILNNIRNTNDTPANRASFSKAAGINAILS